MAESAIQRDEDASGSRGGPENAGVVGPAQVLELQLVGLATASAEGSQLMAAGPAPARTPSHERARVSR